MGINNISPQIPKIRPGMLVVTPIKIKGITANRKYVVEEVDEGFLVIRNDKGELSCHSAYQFIEADLYFTMCLFSTLITMYKLGNKAYK